VSKIKMVYQCSVREEQMTTAPPRALQSQWLTQTAHTRQKALTIPAQWKLCATYFRNTIEQWGHYSLPASLFDKAVARNGFDFAAVPNPLDIAIQAVEVRTTDALSSDDLRFFQVVNAFPERRRSHAVHHLDRHATCIRVKRCGVIGRRDSTSEVIVYDAPEAPLELDMLTLVAAMDQALQSLLRWGVVNKRPAAKLRLAPLALDIDSSPLVSIVGLSASASEAPAASSSSLAIVPYGQDPCAIAALSQLRDWGSSIGSPSGARDFSALANMSWSTVECLQAAGAVVVSQGDFGEAMIALNPRAVTWGVLYLLGNPVQHSRLPLRCSPLRSSRVELILALHQQGWQSIAGLAGDWCAGAPLEYAGFDRPASYHAALLYREEILAKGVVRIAHQQVDGYYKALLKLDSAQLLKMLAAMDGKQHDWFAQRL
jgi:hypothetical protein